MRTRVARFIAGAAHQRQLPLLKQPAVAFVGRSNVGKSSLLNRLVGQRKLARVSKRPGRTQQINFFLVDERIVFADLPGYGFARVPAQIQDQWKDLVEAYLSGSADLRLVVVLVDLRRGLQDEDVRLLEYLESVGRRAIIVATKADKLNRDQGKRSKEALAAAAGTCCPVVPSSAVTGEGITELWTEIERACA
jgi:GTP-binding protein